MRAVIALVVLLGVSGCGGTSSHTGSTNTGSTVQARKTSSGGATVPGGSMLMTMTGEHEIRNMTEATAAKERANRTELAIVPLLKELGRPGLSERERADKQQEIDRLREQYRREMEPVQAFYKEIEHKAKEYDRLLKLKDPAVERMREELKRVIERKGKNEVEEFHRIQGEFDRRLAELDRKSQ
jgi:uncharacterized protein YceK